MRWKLVIAVWAALSAWGSQASADTARDCRASKDQDVAIKSCTQLIAADAKDADAYFHRGSALVLKGDTTRAIDDFSKAIEIKPGYAKAYNSRGTAYASKGDYERALADVTRAGELEKPAGKRKEVTKAKAAAAPPPVAKVAAPAPKVKQAGSAAAAVAPETVSGSAEPFWQPK